MDSTTRSKFSSGEITYKVIIYYCKAAVAYVLIAACLLNLRQLNALIDYLLPESLHTKDKSTKDLNNDELLKEIPRKRAAALETNRRHYLKRIAKTPEGDYTYSDIWQKQTDEIASQDGFDEIDSESSSYRKQL
jgi:hypothetical protein